MRFWIWSCSFLGNDFSNASSAIIIMAGGLGKRMNSDLPKVLHKIKQKPMIVHVIERTLELNVSKILIVVGKYIYCFGSSVSNFKNMIWKFLSDR